MLGLSVFVLVALWLSPRLFLSLSRSLYTGTTRALSALPLLLLCSQMFIRIRDANCSLISCILIVQKNYSSETPQNKSETNDVWKSQRPAEQDYQLLNQTGLLQMKYLLTDDGECGQVCEMNVM